MNLLYTWPLASFTMFTWNGSIVFRFIWLNKKSFRERKWRRKTFSCFYYLRIKVRYLNFLSLFFLLLSFLFLLFTLRILLTGCFYTLWSTRINKNLKLFRETSFYKTFIDNIFKNLFLTLRIPVYHHYLRVRYTHPPKNNLM